MKIYFRVIQVNEVRSWSLNKKCHLPKKISLFVFIALLCSCCLYAQKPVTVDYLLDRIETLQEKHNYFFIEGVFPSYINASRKFKTRKKDNTIFYNALIAYVLKDNHNNFSTAQKEICDSIIARSQRASAFFKNKNRNTYNFWRTDTITKFHYSWWLPFFNAMSSLPDDMDDTALGLLMNNENTDSAKALHMFMQAYINHQVPLKTTYKTYSYDSAYSTWFGKKFPVVFDVSVLCNVLAFVQQYNLQWTKADSASLHHILKTIQRNDIVKHPAIVSPYYANTSIILYHLARLMQIKPIDELEKVKPGLVQIANSKLQSSDNILEKIMLGIALKKWGQSNAQINISTSDFKSIEQNNLPFFIGNIPSYFHRSLKGKFTDLRLLMYNHYCPAWNDCLLLEYLLLFKHSTDTTYK
ncbi:MAG: hypothetical protein JST21_16895 [Bacteroidetes bacterium]|nr:hypothetical protein [Bacteroidota bacterium]